VTPVVDEQLLKRVCLPAKSFVPKAHLGIGKDIAIVKRLTSPAAVRDSASRQIEALHTLPTNN